MLLSTLVWLPILGAAALLLLDRRDTRRLRQVALAVSTVTFLVSLLLWIGFDRARPGMQFVEQRAWIPGAGIGYHLGVDGISLLLVLLTTLLTPLCLLSAWSQITTRVKEFLVAMCLLETGMLGVFVALDLFLFFVFWEAMLVPMYLIIGVWGGPRRVYAAVKFFLYTMAGSALMLLAILTLYFLQDHGSASFDYAAVLQLRIDPRLQLPLFLAFALAFAIKVPHVPVPHLAAGRPRGGAHRGQRDPGRRAPEDGDLRLPPLRPAAVPRRGGPAGARHRGAWRWSGSSTAPGCPRCRPT